MRWQASEFNGFLHFTVNTFTGKEWGFGNEPESVFNPTDLDADQIVRTFKEAGMKGVILTAKHHDGFVSQALRLHRAFREEQSWKNRKGDMVREVADACRRQDMKFGVYLSPWDRSHAEFGRPAYVTYYHNQLRELLTNYGPLFEVWFDEAAGADGKGATAGMAGRAGCAAWTRPSITAGPRSSP
ncbi:MAG: alpha-L-fucosidase [Kiritimatiellia bacterium]